MKYVLVALSFAALALAGCATGLRAPTEPFNSDRMLPATPEHELHEYAGAISHDHVIRIQLG